MQKKKKSSVTQKIDEVLRALKRSYFHLVIGKLLHIKNFKHILLK